MREVVRWDQRGRKKGSIGVLGISSPTTIRALDGSRRRMGSAGLCRALYRIFILFVHVGIRAGSLELTDRSFA